MSQHKQPSEDRQRRGRRWPAQRLERDFNSSYIVDNASGRERRVPLDSNFDAL